MDFTKINANDQFDVRGSCLSGCYGDGLVYKFNILLFDNVTKKYELFKDTSYFYQNDYLNVAYLTLMSDLFINNPEEIIYKIELLVFIKSRNVSGSAAMLIYVNFPPVRGSCDINPKIGYAFDTLFTIDCSNFIDKDGTLVSYSFYGNFKKLFLLRLETY